MFTSTNPMFFQWQISIIDIQNGSSNKYWGPAFYSSFMNHAEACRPLRNVYVLESVVEQVFRYGLEAEPNHEDVKNNGSC
jgi:hypothetical protein